VTVLDTMAAEMALCTQAEEMVRDIRVGERAPYAEVVERSAGTSTTLSVRRILALALGRQMDGGTWHVAVAETVFESLS